MNVGCFHMWMVHVFTPNLLIYQKIHIACVEVRGQPAKTVLSFHNVASRHQTVRLGSKCLHPLSHAMGPMAIDTTRLCVTTMCTWTEEKGSPCTDSGDTLGL